MKGLIISKDDIKDFVITKRKSVCFTPELTQLVYNASLICLMCPPLLNLLARPRAATMTDIIEKHNNKGKLLLNKHKK